MEGRLLTAVLCIFTILIASPCWAMMEDEGLHEVVVRIPAESASAKLAVINELVHLGYGSECPKSEQPYIDVKLPEREVAKLKQLKLSTNFTIVEDPVRAEYLRFVEEASKRTKRSAVERADPFDDMFNHYHSQQQISAFLDEIVAQCPTIARKFSIGKTVSGEDMWAIHITDNPDTREVGEPEVQYIANMHGDEVVGRELMLYFIHHLCIHYHQPRVKAIVDNLDLYILPTMNPDGFAGGRRANKHGRDLNRNFPDQYTASTWGGVNPLPPVGNSVNGQYVKSSVEHEPEVEVVMKWMGQHAFALAANFHGGSVVANYPFDGNRQHSSGSYAGSPDDVLYRGLARAYAANNSPMSTSREFPSGITNGAQWYVLYGGMQDYAYLWHGTMHITVELSEVKWPNVASLSDFWEQNRESLLAYLEQAKYRVWGVVTDCASGAPIKAGIVEPSAASCSSNCRLQAAKLDSTTGEYHRLVSRAGDRTDYVFKVSAPGYNQASKTISVRAQSSFPLRLDICLNKSS